MSVLSRLFPRRKSRRQMELDYLSEAVSLYDLECREREVDQGKFRRA